MERTDYNVKAVHIEWTFIKIPRQFANRFALTWFDLTWVELKAFTPATNLRSSKSSTWSRCRTVYGSDISYRKNQIIILINRFDRIKCAHLSAYLVWVAGNPLCGGVVVSLQSSFNLVWKCLGSLALRQATAKTSLFHLHARTFAFPFTCKCVIFWAKFSLPWNFLFCRKMRC